MSGATTPVPGPRPLPLHLAVEVLTWLSSRAALTSSSAVSPSSRPAAMAVAALRNDLAGVDPEAFRRAVDAEAGDRLRAFAAGVVAYARAPRPARPPEPATTWRRGAARLLDYGRRAEAAGPEAPLLVVPSLVNRAYVLDLGPGRSLMRHLVRAGFRPYLIDWGRPGADERGFALDDYVAGTLEAALAEVVARHGRAAGLVGYCMGGLLALALAQRRPREVAALALLATPWDFHCDGMATARLLSAMRPEIETLLAALGELPVDVLQAMFAGLDPWLAGRKFRAFAALDPASPRAAEFIRLEDWANDGVPLTAGVARDCLFGWYVDNAPARGEWRIAGRPVRPAEVAAPTLVFAPARDRIVPPASALALAAALPGAACRRVESGHLGMVVGAAAPALVHAPLADWLSATLSQVISPRVTEG